MYYVKYDAEWNQILDNPMYNYQEFDTADEMFAYADEKGLWPDWGRWKFVPHAVPMPDEYWDNPEEYKKKQALL
jgi:hypothetical protein